MTDSLTAYRAAKESAAVFDLTGWTVLHLAGRDAAKFLHNFCTNDIKKLAPGEGCEAFVTNVKARVVGHVFASKDPANGITLIAAPGAGPGLAAHLDRYIITEDVTITDRTADRALLFVTGPSALDSLRRAGFELAGATAQPEPGRFTVWSEQIGAALCPTRRIDLLGPPGVLIEVPSTDVSHLRDRLSGAAITQGTPDAFEALRVEAAFPLYGIDISEDHLAPEVGRPWAISYTKGCYLGQEPIARIDALGHVNRSLRGLRLDSGPALAPGASVFADDKEIGTVTSSAICPAGGGPIALAYVRAKFAEPGGTVVVRTGQGEVPATVYGPVTARAN